MGQPMSSCVFWKVMLEVMLPFSGGEGIVLCTHTLHTSSQQSDTHLAVNEAQRMPSLPCPYHMHRKGNRLCPLPRPPSQGSKTPFMGMALFSAAGAATAGPCRISYSMPAMRQEGKNMPGIKALSLSTWVASSMTVPKTPSL